jgi:hypothetical protein
MIGAGARREFLLCAGFVMTPAWVGQRAAERKSRMAEAAFDQAAQPTPKFPLNSHGPRAVGGSCLTR